MVSMKVKEETYLTIAETGVETGYDAEHEFILEKSANGWDIVEDKQLEPSGLLPLGVAEEYVEEESQYFDMKPFTGVWLQVKFRRSGIPQPVC